jgi:mycothiol synthase
VPEVVLRAPTLDDVDAVAEVINAEARRLRGRDDVEARAVRGWWTQPPPFDRERDVVVALQEGRVVGYGDLGDQAHDGSVLWLDVRGTALGEVLAELERRALERRAPTGVVRAVADEGNAEYRSLLEGRGYRSIRASYRMTIDLGPATLEPSWPEGAGARAATEGVDEPLLYDLAQRSFADHWGFTPSPYDEWLHWLREMAQYDPTLCFVAERDGAPAGVALCRPRGHGGEPEGWVSVLGVLPAHRGHGLGTALLVTAFAEFRRRGTTRASLGVDAENTTGAVRLYERAGMTVAERQEIWELSA